MKIVGIDIGSFSIKIAEVTPNSVGGTLTNYSEYKLNQDPNVDRRLEIVDILRNFVANFNHNDTHFCVALRQSYVTQRRLSFPFKERFKIQKSLPFELEDNIPLSIDEAVFDPKILSYHGNETQVLATTTSQNHVGDLVQLCNDSGFDSFIISTESFSYANLFEDWQQPPKESTWPKPSDESEQVPTQKASIHLHLGHSHTLGLVYSNNELCEVRSFNFGSAKIAHAIAIKYQLPPKESIKELENKAFILLQEDQATKDQIEFSTIIKSTFSPFIHNLKLSFLELESEFDIEINQIYISGGASLIKNLGPFLTESIEVPCNTVQPSLNHITNKSPSYNAQTGGIALGLAIEGLKKPRNPATNLLRGPFARQNKNFKQFWDKWSYTSKIACTSFVVLCFYGCLRQDFATNMSTQAYDQTIAVAQKVIPNAKRTGVISQANKYIRDQKKKEKDAQLIDKLGDINSALDILKAITNSMPSKRVITVDIRYVDINEEDVTIEGLLNSKDPIAQFEAALKNVAKNKNIQRLATKIKPEAGKRVFAYQFKVNRLNEGQQ